MLPTIIDIIENRFDKGMDMLKSMESCISTMKSPVVDNSRTNALGKLAKSCLVSFIYSSVFIVINKTKLVYRF